MVPLSGSQLAAYASAVYEIEGDDGWIDVLTIPFEANPLPAALISACNPWSQPLSDAENQDRNLGLQRQIEASGYRWRAARGRSANNLWIEPGFLAQAPLDLVDAWARDWQQHAVLVLHGALQAPALRCYSPFAGANPPQQLANMRLEWVGCVPPASP